MLTVKDVFEDPEMIDAKVIAMLESIVEAHGLSEDTPILYTSSRNNDIDGSQHHENTIHFTYRDANIVDVDDCVTAGYYEFFAPYENANSDELYTGNQYEGNGNFFDAIVVDPPDYAATHNVWD